MHSCHIRFNAVDSVDFNIVGSSSATFPAGTPGMACIDVTILDDNVYEGEHDFTLNILSVTPTLQTSAPTSVTITITDREGVFTSCLLFCFILYKLWLLSISSSIHINDIPH